MEQIISKPTMKRVAVVTGGNKGIGFEICRQLASNGVVVILTARDEKRGLDAVESLKGFGLVDVGFHQLDVTDIASAASLASFIEINFGKLDILVNNAAVGGLEVDDVKVQAYKESDEKGDISGLVKGEPHYMAEFCLKTNFFGVKQVTEALLPLLNLSDSARIVNVSSIYGLLSYITNERTRERLGNIESLTEEGLNEVIQDFLNDFKEGLLEKNGWPASPSAYKMSKAAVNAYTRILAKKYPKFIINCVTPGFVKTDINFNTGVSTPEEGARGPVKLALLPDGSPSGLFYNETELSVF